MKTPETIRIIEEKEKIEKESKEALSLDLIGVDTKEE